MKKLSRYQHQNNLYELLQDWTEHAVNILKDVGCKDFSIYGGTYKLTWHPSVIDLSSLDKSDRRLVRNADLVLRTIHQLHEAMFSNDINLIANVSIKLGIEVSKAHSDEKNHI